MSFENAIKSRKEEIKILKERRKGMKDKKLSGAVNDSIKKLEASIKEMEIKKKVK